MSSNKLAYVYSLMDRVNNPWTNEIQKSFGDDVNGKYRTLTIRKTPYRAIDGHITNKFKLEIIHYNTYILTICNMYLECKKGKYSLKIDENDTHELNGNIIVNSTSCTDIAIINSVFNYLASGIHYTKTNGLQFDSIIYY